MAKGLGKGINALFPPTTQSEHEELIIELEVTQLRPNPYQPRKHFNDESIQELSVSIQEHGVLQPIIARKSIKGYEIVAGERRFRAAKAAGLTKLPVIVRTFTEEQMMEIALIENLQREDLNPIEEAVAYQKLIEHLHLTQEELATRVGKSRPHIANFVRLLQLPSPVQDLLADGTLTMGHGRALVGLKKKAKLQSVVQKCLDEKMNVRQLEKFVQLINENVPRETKKKTPAKNVFLAEKETALRAHFGTSVSIKRSKRKGKIEIEFFSDDDLERILQLLGNE
ncbi:stage 0 sporulation protein J [Fictibacillus macauensis ZFHKF-1]|uniref:Stage 0 sporulation protein J n=1 Tax=Fictibacillus macauensis ZFHKF-1 TaxID=1196324 RepID=I8AJY8_9BACL|nr:ParB/RepB/Spo0J family partition protein [Fictibacillus macauensis]EIT86117.1 stage 0 sporulation protein J [Fictibacillus macauensis ZFHKF-1]